MKLAQSDRSESLGPDNNALERASGCLPLPARGSMRCSPGIRAFGAVLARALLGLILWAQAPLSLASAEEASTPALVRISAERGWGAITWEISVSAKGQVRVYRTLPDAKPKTYSLSDRELRELVADLKIERPWELPSQLGNAVVDGPSRQVDMVLEGRRVHFGLYSLPNGVSLSSLGREAGVLARGFRVCERIRLLASDERLQPCTE